MAKLMARSHHEERDTPEALLERSEWAPMGTRSASDGPGVIAPNPCIAWISTPEQDFRGVGGPGLEPGTSCL
jgi:hypothetical protein